MGSQGEEREERDETIICRGYHPSAMSIREAACCGEFHQYARTGMYIQGASLRGRHTPLAALALKGKIV